MDYRSLPFVRALLDSGFGLAVEDNELVINVTGGFTIRVPTSLAYSGLGMAVERFVWQEFESLNVRDAVVVDIGANIGDSAIYFVGRGAYRVLAYEPFPDTAAMAARNIACNSLDELVELVAVGVGAQECTRPAEYDPLYPHLASASGSHGAAKTVRIQMTTLSRVLRRAHNLSGGVRRVVLKVDCEGCEGEIFAGDPNVLEGIGSVLIETHSAQLRQQITDYLESAGFDCETNFAAATGLALIVGTRPSQ
jgi:FkbM family methyltransferase